MFMILVFRHLFGLLLFHPIGVKNEDDAKDNVLKDKFEIISVILLTL